MTQLKVGYLASNTGAVPFSPRSDGRYLMKNSGGNTGNLAFWQATRDMFDDPTMLVEWDRNGARYRDQVDRLVIPAANHLNPEWSLDVLADLIESLGREVVVFGLGAQAQNEDDECILQAGTIRYLKSLSAHATTIFVRGAYTAELCAKYGVKNVEVLGCPSITISSDANLGSLIASRYDRSCAKLYCAGAAFKGITENIERLIFKYIQESRGSTYVIQAPEELIDLTRGMTPSDSASKMVDNAKRILAPNVSTDDFREMFKRTSRCYSSVRAWLEDASYHDYAICTRIHGAIMSLMAGVPTIVIGHDARVRELCNVMLIPWLPPAEAVGKFDSIEALFRQLPIDGPAFDQNRRRIAQRYRAYLETSGFNVSSNLRTLCDEVPASRDQMIKSNLNSQERYHQRDRSTAYNRYPSIFSRVEEICRSWVPHGRVILSYGCSSGEEVVTLSNDYFPDFKIVGVDINPEAIALAARHHVDANKVSFHISSTEIIQTLGPYDIIFAMSVFCRWPESQGLDDISTLYPFEHFEKGLKELDSYLRVGGMIVIANANFSFLETSLARNYESIPIQIDSSGFVERFDINNRPTKSSAPPDCIFRKIR